MCKSARPTQNPHMIFIIDCDIGTESHSPLCWHPRKIRIELELRQPTLTNMRSLHRRGLFGDLGGHQTCNRPNHQHPNEDEASHHVAPHGVSFLPKRMLGVIRGLEPIMAEAEPSAFRTGFDGWL